MVISSINSSYRTYKYSHDLGAPPSKTHRELKRRRDLRGRLEEFSKLGYYNSPRPLELPRQQSSTPETNVSHFCASPPHTWTYTSPHEQGTRIVTCSRMPIYVSKSF